MWPRRRARGPERPRSAALRPDVPDAGVWLSGPGGPGRVAYGGPVLGVLEGFGIITAVIAVGFLLGHFGFLSLRDQATLSKVAFWVATPALLITMLAEADLGSVFGARFVAPLVGMGAVALVAVAIWRFAYRTDVPTATIAALDATFINSVNLGIPVALFALGDAAAVLPMLMVQSLIFQPIAFAVLDVSTSLGERSLLRSLLRPLINPLNVGTAFGVLLAVTGWDLPQVVGEPIRLVGGISVPAMLLAYGLSLRLGPRPGSDGGFGPTVVASVLKLVALPAVVIAVGAGPLGLRGHDLLAVAVVAALPTAQNIFIQAAAYNRAVVLSRDTIFVTTVLSVPVVLALTALLA